MAKLTTSKKNAEPKGDFGLPEERKYPIPMLLTPEMQRH